MGAAQTSKIGLMFILLCVDLIMNCSFDYDNLGFTDKVDFLVVVLGIQVVVEISIFLALFLAMAETFLFRVGLLGLLMKKFRLALLIHPLYLALTIAAGALRVRQLSQDGDMVALQNNSSFIAVSVVQKLVAVVYYVVNMRATLKLGSSLYFDRTLWVSLVNENKKIASA